MSNLKVLALFRACVVPGPSPERKKAPLWPSERETVSPDREKLGRTPVSETFFGHSAGKEGQKEGSENELSRKSARRGLLGDLCTEYRTAEIDLCAMGYPTKASESA